MSDELEDGDDEELPTKSELEWMILKYLQPIHRYLSICKTKGMDLMVCPTQAACRPALSTGNCGGEIGRGGEWRAGKQEQDAKTKLENLFYPHNNLAKM